MRPMTVEPVKRARRGCRRRAVRRRVRRRGVRRAGCRGGAQLVYGALSVMRRSRHDMHGALQAEVMRTVWELGEATVDEVRAAQPKDSRSAYTTVQTVLNRLLDRGLLERDRRGKAFVYGGHGSADEPVGARAAAGGDRRPLPSTAAAASQGCAGNRGRRVDARPAGERAGDGGALRARFAAAVRVRTGGGRARLVLARAAFRSTRGARVRRASGRSRGRGGAIGAASPVGGVGGGHSALGFAHAAPKPCGGRGDRPRGEHGRARFRHSRRRNSPRAGTGARLRAGAGASSTRTSSRPALPMNAHTCAVGIGLRSRSRRC